MFCILHYRERESHHFTCMHEVCRMTGARNNNNELRMILGNLEKKGREKFNKIELQSSDISLGLPDERYIYIYILD